MSFTRDWDESTPTNQTYGHQIDDYMRYLRVDVADRLEDMYYGFIAGENTYSAHAKMIQFRNQTSVSTPSSGYARLYTKQVSSQSELHFLGDDGNEKQLTSGGQLNIEAADIPADTINETKIQLQNDAFLEASNAAGDGTVDLIKANSSDLAELPDGATLATDTAPTEDAQIANKKYVDDCLGQSDIATGTTDISLNAGDWTDMTDMSIAMTTSGGNLLVMFTATFESYDDECVLGLRLDLDGSPYCTQQHWIQTGSLEPQLQDRCVTIQYLFTSVSADAHTVKVQWKDVTGNVKQDGTDFPRVLTVVELPS